jgi:hypothetical protein
MNVIETEYKGCRFRSRLEARWAVFFHALNLTWEYEAEGFILPNNDKYLPDFWLPEMECFFEVKGSTPTDSERYKAFHLSTGSKKLVAITSGLMAVEELVVGDRSYGEWSTKGFKIELFAGEAHEKWLPISFDFPIWNWSFEVDLPPFIQDQFPSEILIDEDTEERRKKLVHLDREYYFKKYRTEHPNYKWGRHENSVSWVRKGKSAYGFALEPDSISPQISGAYKAARSARFEHGESPK